MSPKLLFVAVSLLLVFTHAVHSCVDVYINEINIDQKGTDLKDFVELYSGPHANLNNLSVVFFNGKGSVPYMNVSLQGYTASASGYFLIGQSSVSPHPDIVVPNIQNGADGIGLYCNNHQMALTSVGLVDAIVYDNGKDPNGAQGLLSVLTPGSPIAEEDVSGSVDKSLSRCLCQTLRDNQCYTNLLPTPKAQNSCPTTTGPTTTTTSPTTTMPACPQVIINEVDADQSGHDDKYFLELRTPGGGNVALDGVTVIFFNGANDQAYQHFGLDGHQSRSNGLFVIGASTVHPDIVSGDLQNGPDGIGVYCRPDGGLALTNQSLIDAVVYGKSLNSDAAHLISILTPGTGIASEGSSLNSSLTRCSCCAVRNDSLFIRGMPTPGLTNDCPNVPSTTTPTIATSSFTTSATPSVTSTVSVPDYCSMTLNVAFGGARTAKQLCLNGAACANSVNGASCLCRGAFTGTFCETAIPSQFESVQRCSLSSSTSTSIEMDSFGSRVEDSNNEKNTSEGQQQSISTVCPPFTVCVPANHRCFFQSCSNPVGWCLALAGSPRGQFQL